jgi:adenylosuccinate lyase
MPHKRNPIVSERVCGLARVIRANLQAALEDVALWHERDISHSSVERVILPDSSMALDYMLHLMTRLIDGLVVSRERMGENLESTHGLVYSQRVLLALIDQGLSRDEAYTMVQGAAADVWERGGAFGEAIAAGARGRLDPAQLEALFDPAWFVRNLDGVFTRLEKLHTVTDDEREADPSPGRPGEA